jgi:hypothetical protein
VVSERIRKNSKKVTQKGHATLDRGDQTEK